MPPVQPMTAPQMAPQPGTPNLNAPQPAAKKDMGDVIKIIVIVALALTTVTFIGLFVWMMLQYNEASTDVNGQIAIAVAEAKDEQALQDEAEFLEREKYPYQTFSGPADYGELTFQYPKTWSVYVASDAAKGGDFKAYLNPVQVNEVSDNTIMALRVTIRTDDFEKVTAEYQRKMEARDADLTMESITFADGITANKYTGKIPDTDLRGYIVVFKIRDKAVILQTDSEVFKADFDRLLETVKFNA